MFKESSTSSVEKFSKEKRTFEGSFFITRSSSIVLCYASSRSITTFPL